MDMTVYKSACSLFTILCLIKRHVCMCVRAWEWWVGVRACMCASVHVCGVVWCMHACVRGVCGVSTHVCTCASVWCAYPCTRMSAYMSKRSSAKRGYFHKASCRIHTAFFTRWLHWACSMLSPPNTVHPCHVIQLKCADSVPIKISKLGLIKMACVC